MSSSSSTADVAKALGIDLDSSIGAAFIGLIFCATLYGVTLIQCIHYFENCHRDSKYMKGAIGFLLFLDTLHLVLISHTMYTLLVTNFGNLFTITDTMWSLQLMVFCTVLSVCIVDLCYVHRLWILSGNNRLLTFPPIALVVVAITAGFAIGAKCFEYDSVLQLTQISWVFYTSFVGAIIIDIWITSSLCYYLYKNKSDFRGSNRKIRALMTYIINTGLLSSICAICILATYSALPNTYIFLALYESYSKIFFNALLAMLNARGKLSGPGFTDSGSGGSSAFSHGTGKVVNMLRLSAVGGGRGGKKSDMRFARPSLGHTFSSKDTGVSTGESELPEMFAMSERKASNIAVNVSVDTDTDYNPDEKGSRGPPV